MGSKLNENELENVAGGGCNDSGECDECKRTIKNETYWTCTFTDDVIGQKSYSKNFKLCNDCAAKAKSDKRYSNWKMYLGK